MAIVQSPDQKLTLNGIYEFIKNRYPYYKKHSKKLYCSIRHNLSLNDCFVKIPRKEDNPGKGNFWVMHPESSTMYEHGSFRRRRGRFIAKVKNVNKIQGTPYGRTYGLPKNEQLSHVDPSTFIGGNLQPLQDQILPDFKSDFKISNPSVVEERPKKLTNFSIETILSKPYSSELTSNQSTKCSGVPIQNPLIIDSFHVYQYACPHHCWK